MHIVTFLACYNIRGLYWKHERFGPSTIVCSRAVEWSDSSSGSSSGSRSWQLAAAGKLWSCGAAAQDITPCPVSGCCCAREKSDLVTTTTATTAPRPVWVAAGYMNTHAGGKRKH